MLEVLRIENVPVPSCCFIIYDKAMGTGCILVDPGSECNDGLYAKLEKLGLTPEYIILTHEHFDHCWGVNDLRRRFPQVKLVCSRECSHRIGKDKQNMSVFYDQKGFEVAPADIIVEDIDFKLDWRGYTFEFLSTPGHTNASICILVDKYLFTGDTVIKGLKTVTKLPTGSAADLEKSLALLRQKTSGGSYIIKCGHGEDANHI